MVPCFRCKPGRQEKEEHGLEEGEKKKEVKQLIMGNAREIEPRQRKKEADKSCIGPSLRAKDVR